MTIAIGSLRFETRDMKLKVGNEKNLGVSLRQGQWRQGGGTEKIERFDWKGFEGHPIFYPFPHLICISSSLWISSSSEYQSRSNSAAITSRWRRWQFWQGGGGWLTFSLPSFLSPAIHSFASFQNSISALSNLILKVIYQTWFFFALVSNLPFFCIPLFTSPLLLLDQVFLWPILSLSPLFPLLMINRNRRVLDLWCNSPYGLGQHWSIDKWVAATPSHLDLPFWSTSNSASDSLTSLLLSFPLSSFRLLMSSTA